MKFIKGFIYTKNVWRKFLPKNTSRNCACASIPAHRTMNKVIAALGSMTSSGIARVNDSNYDPAFRVRGPLEADD
jgi:hypothetical protein